MKLQLFFVISALTLVFTSCNLVAESNNTPDIKFYSKPILNDYDSLNLWMTNEVGTIRLDTISIGDSVQFQFVLNAFSNNITSIYITQTDTSIAKIQLPPVEALNTVFLSSSNYKDGRFMVIDNVKYLYFSFKYFPKKASTSEKLTILMTSDANLKFFGGSNSNSITLKTPIVTR